MNEKEDKKQFVVLMGILAEALPSKEPMTKNKAKIYFEFLKTYSIKNVTFAIKQAIRKFDYFPSVHQILEIMGPFPDEPERMKIDMKFEMPKLLDWEKP
jgi:hypothetical protein